MMLKRLLFCLVLGAAWPALPGKAQELQANVTVVADRIRGVDPSVFRDLQRQVQELLNTRSWSGKHYAPDARIACNFLINLQNSADNDVFSGTLTVQAVRPVYNSSYVSPLLNYQDRDLSFRFKQYQPLVFNETRVSGNDALESNLTAVLAYYAYIIIGLDQDSFADHGGDAMFRKAQNIVNNAPENSKSISGWKAFDGTRNRYWLTENLLNPRYDHYHQVLYQYHRQGLDAMYGDMAAGRKAVVQCLNTLNAIHAENPSNMILPLFFVAKAEELTGIFSQAPTAEKTGAIALLQKMDPAHGNRYQEDMKP